MIFRHNQIHQQHKASFYRNKSGKDFADCAVTSFLHQFNPHLTQSCILTVDTFLLDLKIEFISINASFLTTLLLVTFIGDDLWLEKEHPCGHFRFCFIICPVQKRFCITCNILN